MDFDKFKLHLLENNLKEKFVRNCIWCDNKTMSINSFLLINQVMDNLEYA